MADEAADRPKHTGRQSGTKGKKRGGKLQLLSGLAYMG